MQIITYKERSPFQRLRFILIFILISFFSCLHTAVYSQSGGDSGDSNGSMNEPLSSSINFDGRMLAGLNGDSMFSLSMTQGLEDFAYQLNSGVVYTNDFMDYSNSSFVKNETGFTGEIGLGESWKVIPQFEIANSTYGMFDNPYYSRENRDKISLRLKTEYKPSPRRWDFDISCARYDHGLKRISIPVEESDTIYTGRCLVSMEYIWSDANKAGFILEGAGYNYPGEFSDDAYANGEFYTSFKVTEFIMLTLAPVCTWNRDGTNYIYFKGNISTISLKYVSLELLHEYKLMPFRPEEVFMTQKYVKQGLDLAPCTVNHSELNSKFDFDFSAGSDSLFSISSMGLKLKGIFESSNNFYNYVSLPDEYVLDAEAVSAQYINANAEFVTTFIIMRQKFNIDFIYSYYRFFTGNKDVNITYRPENTFTFNLTLDGALIDLEWSNSYKGSVYTDPDSDNKLDEVIAGNLDIHFKVYETFYIDSRISNLYNRKYYYRDGYPEPGIQFFAGLRVMI